MRLGYTIFEALDPREHVHEVFPSASCQMLVNDHEATVTIDFAHLAQGPKDMLDACVAAVTGREFVSGRGCEVGGGDGLGMIVLPRPLSLKSDVEQWPEAPPFSA